jgi:shikimate dehydrogenase
MRRSLRFAVLGDPIEHSRSPAIHTAALDHLEIDGSYVAISAGHPELQSAVRQLRDGALDGINVTMPLKADAAALADSLTSEAARSGSVNTMRARDGLVEGLSSDVIASRRAAEDSRFPPGAAVLVLGAGGAAAAVLVGTADRDLYVAARDERRAGELIERVGVDAGVIPFGAGVAGALVFNATPLGMGGERLPAEVTGIAAGIVDLAYGETETPAIAEARNRGLPVMDGVEFLVLQAAVSFEWWLGRSAPIEVMAAAARKT